MSNKFFWMIIPVLALISISCQFTINMPFTEIKTGALQSEQIQVDLPAGTDVSRVTLQLGAGELKLNPGTGSYLVDGIISYNVSDFKPAVKITGQWVSIEQGRLDVRGIPSFTSKIMNTWDLKLAPVPMELTVQAGGYNGEIELGGLEIQRLEISDGASEVELNFSTANPGEMETFRYNTGASNIIMKGLSNANFKEMHLRSGAGNYTLDFSGELQQDANVQIDSGFSNIRIIVPAGANARATIEGALTNIDSRGGWVRDGSAYVTSGSGPLLQIQIKMGAGNIELSNW